MYKLVNVAPDGEHTTDGNFDTIEDAQQYAADMGSRWYFYPITMIADDTSMIVDVCDHMFDWALGMEVSQLKFHAVSLMKEWGY